MTNDTESLDDLRKKVEKLEEDAARFKARLLVAAVAEAVTSDKYGHVSAVARRAGITGQYLRDLVEKQHPGWLAEAARNREARKAKTKDGTQAAA
ncbi:hypothetical protein ACFVZH_37335 [Streptomyces sp. NPDC059534]|uniref:hypothetical protein n=1 Tax=Streptomyces sp. NPDC059534 TaxID=3346859 RepID=UPI00368447E6